MNVIEIDAASNNGVENIRDIREQVQYPPTDGRYRVYIIDEVHMLSIGAFNALLKTLEEPPEYVIFILATTEAHKIPVTILSRCQRYDFRRITVDTITGRLDELAKREGMDVEDKALRYIARAADGSMRDALSLLDQCVAFYLNERLTYEHVLDILGAVDTSVFSRLLRYVMDQDVAGALKLVEEVVIQGRELGQFVTDFTWYLRNLMLIQSSDQLEDVLDMSSENLDALKEEAAQIKQAANSGMQQPCQSAEPVFNVMPWASHSHYSLFFFLYYFSSRFSIVIHSKLYTPHPQNTSSAIQKRRAGLAARRRGFFCVILCAGPLLRGRGRLRRCAYGTAGPPRQTYRPRSIQ